MSDRSRSRYREREGDRGRDRSPDRDRDRSHTREERTKQYSKFACTNSTDPALVNSRVFIGNLPSNKIDRHDIVEIFEKYGNVLAVSVLTGYGFVQFAHEDDAREAVQHEQGTTMKGLRLDIKMAAEGRNKKKVSHSPPRRPSPPPRRDSLYERRDPLDDPYRRRALPPLRDLYDRRDPFVRDRLPPPRSPVDYYPPPPPRPATEINLFRPPYECEIILTSPTLRSYADSIESQLKPHGMIVQHNVVKSDADIPKAVEDLTRFKVPYAIIIGEKNEAHRSITLNILHGTPQEHRNMPLEDALKLIVRTFDAYVQEIRDKASAPPPPPPPPPPPAARPLPPTRREIPEFLPPDEHTTYLLNLLADNRILNVDELEHVIGYLEKRRQVLVDGQRAKAAPKALSPMPEKRPDNKLEFTHADISVSRSSESYFPASEASPMPSTSNSAAINFNNPSVQKALEALMQSGPKILQNIAKDESRMSAPSSSYSGLGMDYSGLGTSSSSLGASSSFRDDMLF